MTTTPRRAWVVTDHDGRVLPGTWPTEQGARDDGLGREHLPVGQDVVQVAAGMRFESRRMIEGSPKAGTARPVVCTVTMVRAGIVWYRTGPSGRANWRHDLDRFDTVAARILTPTPTTSRRM